VTSDGKCPFQAWLEGYRRDKIHGIILVRFRRVTLGLFGATRAVGEGITELKFDVGPGWRVYFGQDDNDVIILNGGRKKTQSADIAVAKAYWEDYKRRAKKND
jgi:putative addiction module killer protein